MAFAKLLAAAKNQTKQLTAVLTKNTLANWSRVLGSIQPAVITGSLMTVLRAICLNVSTNTVTCIFRGRTTEHG
jgi:hypothetical protein